MTGPGKAPTKPQKGSSLEEGLDKSRKHKLWMTLNTVGMLSLIGFIGLSIIRVTNDIRGEYTANAGRLNIVRLSVEHNDGQIFARLTIPKTHPLQCNTADKNIGDNVDWPFVDAYTPTAPAVVHFLGKAEAGTISGVLKDSINIYPIKLQRDDLASVGRQIRTAIPNSNDDTIK